MSLYRISWATWYVGTGLIVLSWFNLVEHRIGWYGFYIAAAASILHRVFGGRKTEHEKWQEQITHLDEEIEQGGGKLADHLLDRGIAKYHISRCEDAILDLNGALENGVEDRCLALSYRGYAEIAVRRHDDAIESFTAAIDAEGESSEPGVLFAWRAAAHLGKGEFGASIADYDRAIEHGRESADDYFFRGKAELLLGDYRRAHENFVEALEIDPDHPGANGQLASILACSPLSELRDGKKAIDHALRDCQKSKWRDWRPITLLAASYAETGDFEKAVRFAKKALRIAPDDAKEVRQARVEQYQRNEPYRFDVDELQREFREEMERCAKEP